eukprot:853005-Pelagomonas_calceolata.AAC.1
MPRCVTVPYSPGTTLCAWLGTSPPLAGQARSSGDQFSEGHARGQGWTAAGQPDDQEVSCKQKCEIGWMSGGHARGQGWTAAGQPDDQEVSLKQAGSVKGLCVRRMHHSWMCTGDRWTKTGQADGQEHSLEQKRQHENADSLAVDETHIGTRVNIGTMLENKHQNSVP